MSTKTRRVAAFASIAFAITSSSSASADEFPMSVACEFTAGTSTSYEDGRFETKVPAPVSFEIEKVDLEGQTATLKPNAGAAGVEVKIVRAINASHFLEAVNEGFLNVTTVYDKDPTTGKFPAVHSRHFGLLGSPVFSQYAGTCLAK